MVSHALPASLLFLLCLAYFPSNPPSPPTPSATASRLGTKHATLNKKNKMGIEVLIAG